MLARQPDRMTEADYLAWEARQHEKWELVDGYPVLRAVRKGWITPTGMAGGSILHALVKGNIDEALRRRLNDGPCQSLTSDVRIRVSAEEYRYPDVVVNCAPPSLELYATNPTVVFEVLSPSNSRRDQDEREDDYKGVASIRHIVFVDTREAFARVWSRAGDLWPSTRVQGLDRDIELPTLGIALPLSEIYKGWTFPDA